MKRSKLLLVAYLAISLVGRVLDPRFAWWQTALDFGVLLPGYCWLIRRFTDPPQVDLPPVPGHRVWLVVGALVTVIAAATTYFYLHPATASTQVLAPSLEGVAMNAVGSTIVFTLPVIAMCWFLRMSPRNLGVRPRSLGLTLALIAIGIALAFVLDQPVALRTMPALAVPIFLLHIFVNGLPEELLFRGLLLQRILGIVRDPIVAIVIVCVLFDASHFPIEMWRRGDRATWHVFALGLQPTSLVWSYLFYRTRSLWPGVLWHTSFTIFGTLFV